MTKSIEIAKRLMGRPRKWTTPEDLEKDIINYFSSLIDEDAQMFKSHPTMSGLALSLGVDRRTLCNYKKQDEFFPTIERARQVCESHLESLMMDSSNGNLKFVATNNYNWRERQDINHGGQEDNPIKADVNITDGMSVKEAQDAFQAILEGDGDA